MTFGEFIKAISSLKLISITRDKLAAELFNSLGPEKKVYETTVKPWIDKKELGSYKKYFRDKEPSEDGFTRYLKMWPSLDWKILREEFGKIDTDIVIDLENDDKDVFYRSLFQQFLFILKFKSDSASLPTIESLISEEASNENDEESTNGTPIEQMLDIFSNLLYKYRIVEVLSSDIIEDSMDIVNFVEAAKSGIINRFLRLQSEMSYLKIREFILEIENYYHLCFMATSESCTDVFTLLHEEENDSNKFGKSALLARKDINAIYGEIFKGQTLFVY